MSQVVPSCQAATCGSPPCGAPPNGLVCSAGRRQHLRQGGEPRRADLCSHHLSEPDRNDRAGGAELQLSTEVPLPQCRARNCKLCEGLTSSPSSLISSLLIPHNKLYIYINVSSFALTKSSSLKWAGVLELDLAFASNVPLFPIL